MAGFNRIPTHQPQQYENDMSPFAGAHQSGQPRSRNPLSAVTDRITRGVMGYMDHHSQRTLDKLDYAFSLHARRGNGEDISWRSPRFAPAPEPQTMEGDHDDLYGRDEHDQRPPPPPPRPGQREFAPQREGEHRFAPGLPPRPEVRRPQEDLRSEYGDHAAPTDRSDALRQAMAEHLEGLPEMIHGMLADFMQDMQQQFSSLAQRVEQLERQQAMQAPPALPPRQSAPALREEAPPPLPPRSAPDNSATPSMFRRRPVGGHAPQLPSRSATQQSLDVADRLTAPALREEERGEREPLAPVARRAFPPPPLHPDAALRRRERDAQMRRMSISTDTTTETQETRADAEQYVDNDDSRTHEQNYRTRPLVDEPRSSGSAAPGLAQGVGEGGSNQTNADAAKVTLANLKAYTNLNHEALDFTERLTR